MREIFTIGKSKTSMNKIKSRFTKKNEFQILSLSISLGFMLLFFTPVKLFVENPAAYNIELKYVAVTMLIAAIVTSFFLDGLLNLVLFINETAYNICVRLFFGALLAFSVQKLFFNNVPILNVADSRYDKYKTITKVNTIIFFLIFTLPLIFYVVERFLPSLKKSWIITSVSALIFFIQLVGAGIPTVKSLSNSDNKGLHRKYLSYEPALSMSSEENIVVFLVDRLDRIWMDEMLERYDEIYKEFDGFTYYQNNVSTGTSTFPTVPEMLTCKKYEYGEWQDYLSDAWSGDTIMSRLKENGYDVNLLPDRITTVSGMAQIDSQCDNILTFDESDVNLNYLGENGIMVTMSRLSAAELVPNQFKPKILYWMGANFSRGFVNFSSADYEPVRYAVGIESELQIYDCLKKYGLNSDSENKTFSFIHLNGAHTPTPQIASIYEPTEEADLYTTIRGNFEILFEYFQQMKELGIYDNTTIIVLGDHGRVPREISGRGLIELDDSITTALLIKPAESASEPLKTDCKAELSIDHFSASILEYAGIDHGHLGYSYNDVIENNISHDRYIRTYDFGGYGRMIYKSLYKITGDARDFDNWELCEDELCG